MHHYPTLALTLLLTSGYLPVGWLLAKSDPLHLEVQAGRSLVVAHNAHSRCLLGRGGALVGGENEDEVNA